MYQWKAKISNISNILLTNTFDIALHFCTSLLEFVVHYWEIKFTTIAIKYTNMCSILLYIKKSKSCFLPMKSCSLAMQNHCFFTSAFEFVVQFYQLDFIMIAVKYTLMKSLDSKYVQYIIINIKNLWINYSNFFFCKNYY